MNLTFSNIQQKASEINVSLEPEVIDRLGRYAELLAKWNRTYNLTAIRDESKFVSHHLLDSLAVLPHLIEGSLIDVGSGGGLPGIPIALADPGRDVVLVESSHKKGAFLRQAVVELEMKNVRVVNDRVENFRPLTRFENVISRAFADLAEFIRVAAHLRSDTGVLLAMKGLVPYEELSQIPADWIAHSTLPLRVPELDATRHLIVMLPQTIRK